MLFFKDNLPRQVWNPFVSWAGEEGEGEGKVLGRADGVCLIFFLPTKINQSYLKSVFSLII